MDTFLLSSFSVLSAPGDRTQLSAWLLLKEEEKKKTRWHLKKKFSRLHTSHQGRLSATTSILSDCQRQAGTTLSPPSPQSLFSGTSCQMGLILHSQRRGRGEGYRSKERQGNVRCWWATVWGNTSSDSMVRDWLMPLSVGSLALRGKRCIPVWKWALSRILRSPERKKQTVNTRHKWACEQHAGKQCTEPRYCIIPLTLRAPIKTAWIHCCVQPD